MGTIELSGIPFYPLDTLQFLSWLLSSFICLAVSMKLCIYLLKRRLIWPVVLAEVYSIFFYIFSRPSIPCLNCEAGQAIAIFTFGLILNTFLFTTMFFISHLALVTLKYLKKVWKLTKL